LYFDTASTAKFYFTEGVLRRISSRILSAPQGLFIHTADAVHLTTAQEAGEREVWTNDRHMLAAAAYFGLSG
jgi:predicted nucleic acid-binding protein